MFMQLPVGYGRKTDFLIKQGFGFVEFDDYRDADDAVYELNGKEILGERVSVEHARGTRRGRSRSRDRRDSRDKPWLDKYGPPTRTDYRITIENLSTRVSWQVRWFEISEYFSNVLSHMRLQLNLNFFTKIIFIWCTSFLSCNQIKFSFYPSASEVSGD